MPDVKPMKTEGVDISPEAVESACAFIERSSPDVLGAQVIHILRVLRLQLTASEKHMDQLQNGTMLDEFNHDDNSLETLADRCSDAYVAKELRKHVAILKGNT